MATWRCSACLGADLFGFVGVEPGTGFLDGPVDLGVGAAVRHRCDVTVHERSCVGGESDGAGGDLAGLPDRHLAGHDARPEAGEAVVGLDGVAEVALPGVGGDPQGERELGDAELRDQGCTLTGDRELALGAVHVAASTIDSAGCMIAHCDGELELRGSRGRSIVVLDSRAARRGPRTWCPGCRGAGSLSWFNPIRGHRQSGPISALEIPAYGRFPKLSSNYFLRAPLVGGFEAPRSEPALAPQPPRRRTDRPGADRNRSPPYRVNACRRPTTGGPQAAGVSMTVAAQPPRPPST